MNEKFCPLPFNHLYVEPNGNYNVCCQHKAPLESIKNVNFDSHESWWNSEYLDLVRQDFINGNMNQNCRRCWHNESLGFESLRMRSLKEYRILGTKKTHDNIIKNIEIDLENTCNLKCLMCNEQASSSILAENIRLGVNKISQRDIKWSKEAYENIKRIVISDSHPLMINIRGGEPFYTKKLLDLVNSIPDEQANKILLHVTTNATIWNQTWQQALSRFRIVRFMFSLDAIGDVYEYIRHPAKWNDVEKNVLEMSSLPNSKPLVHCVLQNLNVLYLESLIDWCQQHNLHLNIDNLITPEFMVIDNIPDHHKKNAISSLEKILSKQLPEHLKITLGTCVDILKNSSFDPNKWARFADHVVPRDRLRGNDYRKILG